MKLLSSTCFLSLTLLLQTANAGNLKDLVLKCSKIELNADRLNCFDLMSNKLNRKLAVKTSKKITTIKNNTASQSIPIKKKESIVDEFGSSHLKINKAKTSDAITLTLLKTKQNPRKELILFFENGQVWQQKGHEYFKVKPGDSLKLTKGSLGAIYMKKDNKDSKRKIRVKRIK